MSSDVLLIVVGVVFIWWSWWFPRKMLDIRDRLAATGGNVEKFERARRGTIIKNSSKLIAPLGVVLVIVGIIELRL